MGNMEHAIEHVAQVVDGILRADPQIAHAMYGYEASYIARALAGDGLLAPAPLREEWGIRWDDGVWEYYRNRAEAEAGAGDEGTPVHRYVSGWLPVDPTEGDGRADQ